MRLTEIYQMLLEYDRDITMSKFGQKIADAASNDEGQTPEEAIDALERMDPTNNKKYIIWLINQYIKKMFRLEDSARVNELLTHFVKLQKKLTYSDLNRYTFSTLDREIDQIMGTDIKTDGTQVDDNDDGANVMYKGPLGYLAELKTEEASCRLGSGTK